MILFRRVRWQNLLSTGNIFTEIKLDKSKSTLVVGENGAGKAQPLTSLVLTPTGFVPMGTIQPGSKVIAGDGTTTLVKSVHPQGQKQVYLITFEDQRQVECSGDHLWNVYALWRGQTHATRWNIQTKTTEEIIEYMTTSTNPNACYVPLFGVRAPLSDNSYYFQGRTAIDGRWYDFDKMTPGERLGLLQGIFDVGGRIITNRSVRLKVENYQLGLLVQRIAWSLGATARLKQTGKQNYEIYFKHSQPENFFRDGHKHNRCVERSYKNLQYNKIVSIEKTDKYVDMQCITIDHPSKLYVTDNYIVTHNSSMLDALHFGLFGKPFRNINKGQLINTITNKALLVEIEFETNGKEYLIRRGIKPNIFEIIQNGKLINESSSAYDYQDFFESNILKFNSKTFKQIVVLGSADYVPFMQLNPQNRRAVIEDLLDIQIFSTMSLLLRDKISLNKSAVGTAEYKVKLIEEKIGVHKQNLKDLRSSLKLQREQQLEDKRKIQFTLNDFDLQRTLLNEQLAEFAHAKTKQDKLKNKLGSADAFLVKYRKTVDRLDTEKNFYSQTDNCPTCKQEIDEKFKLNKIQEIDQHKLQLDQTKDQAIQVRDQLIDQLKSLQAELDYVGELSKQIAECNNQIAVNTGLLRQIDNQLSKDQQVVTTQNNQQAIVELTEDLATAKQEMVDLESKRKVLVVSQSILRDGGIKTKIIKQYIPIINKLINKYLAALDFFVNFEIDENFNESIKSRYRDEFTYASFSEGEKLRIDLSLMFAWRAVAKMRNSAATNLLIMDEVFDSSLDATGAEEFLKILDALAEGTNTFVISHRGESLYDKFHSVIKFEKHNNFSRIAKTA